MGAPRVGETPANPALFASRLGSATCTSSPRYGVVHGVPRCDASRCGIAPVTEPLCAPLPRSCSSQSLISWGSTSPSRRSRVPCPTASCPDPAGSVGAGRTPRDSLPWTRTGTEGAPPPTGVRENREWGWHPWGLTGRAGDTHLARWPRQPGLILSSSWILFDGREFSGEQHVLSEGEYPTLGAMGCLSSATIRSLKKVPVVSVGLNFWVALCGART